MYFTNLALIKFIKFKIARTNDAAYEDRIDVEMVNEQKKMKTKELFETHKNQHQKSDRHSNQ